MKTLFFFAAFLMGLATTAQDRQQAFTFNVLSYGGKGDSLTNNNQPIKRALAAASAIGGGTVVLPRGIFLVDSSFSMPANVRLQGAGKGATKIVSSRLFSGMIVRFEPTTINASLADLSVAFYTAPNRYTYQAAEGVRLGGVGNIIERCEMYNCAAGVGIIDAQDCTIRDNYVHDTGADGIGGFTQNATPSKRIVITGNHVYNTGDDAISCNSYTSATGPADGWIISGNTVKNSGSRGIEVWGGSNIIISDNVIDSTYLAGIVVMGGAGFMATSSVNVFGNQVNNAGKWAYSTINAEGTAGIDVESNGGVTISDISVHDNQIKTPAGSYILVWNFYNSSVLLSNISVKNNKCFGGNSAFVTGGSNGPGVYPGIYVNHTNNATIAGNEVADSYHDGIYVGATCSGTIKILENTVERPNTAGAASKAGIAINSGTVIIRNNSLYDPNSKVGNAVYLSPSLAGTIGTGADNQLGGRVFSSTMTAPTSNFPAAATDIAMYSLRKINPAYSGPAAQIRRSTDNTTQDIGFTAGGAFDVSAFSTFIGAGSGYVVTLYDESGFGMNATQSTNSAQPQLVLNQVNGQPAIFFDGTDDVLVTTSSQTYFKALHGSPATFNVIASIGTVADPNALYVFAGNNGLSGSNTGFYFGYDDRASFPSNDGLRLTVSAGAGSSATLIADLAQNVATAQTWKDYLGTTDPTNATPASRSQLYVNNTAQTPANTLIFSPPSTGAATYSLQIGAPGNSTFFYKGYLAEIILSTAVNTSSDRTARYTNQQTFYGL